MRRYEAYPTIRSRGGLPGVPRLALLAGAVVIAAIALFMLPALLGVGGPGPSSSGSPRASGAGASSSPVVTTPAAPTPQVYVIKSKDNLLKVAKMFGITLDQLLAANPQITNPDKVSLGQQIIIPSASFVPPSARPSTSAAP
jgi:LysM repeat protein